MFRYVFLEQKRTMTEERRIPVSLSSSRSHRSCDYADSEQVTALDAVGCDRPASSMEYIFVIE